MSERDWYEILGVSPDATHEEIRAAYRRLARRYHPDSAEGGGDPKQFQLVQEAWEVLSDPDRRAAYDQKRRLQRLRRGRRRSMVGARPAVTMPVRYTLVMSPHEAARGGTVEVPVPYLWRCPVCLGSGLVAFEPCSDCDGGGTVKYTAVFTVHVPAGVRHNEILHFRADEPVPAEIMLRVALRGSGGRGYY